MADNTLTAEDLADLLSGGGVVEQTPSIVDTQTQPQPQLAPKQSMDGATFKFLLVAAGVLVAEVLLALVVVKDASRKNKLRRANAEQLALSGGVGAAVDPTASGRRMGRRAPHQTMADRAREEKEERFVEPYESDRLDGYASIYQNGTYAML